MVLLYPYFFFIFKAILSTNLSNPNISKWLINFLELFTSLFFSFSFSFFSFILFSEKKLLYKSFSLDNNLSITLLTVLVVSYNKFGTLPLIENFISDFFGKDLILWFCSFSLLIFNCFNVLYFCLILKFKKLLIYLNKFWFTE